MKEPIEPEYRRLRDGLVLFTYLHIAADEPLTRALVESGVTAVAYETVETDDGALPLLAPMSEIAGRLAAQAGAYFLEKPLGGRGLLLGGVPGVAPGRVVVIGGGIVGYNAAVIALGLGANVTILERSIDRMRHLDEILSGRVSLVMSSSLQIEESVEDADVVIGAVLIPGALAPKLITREMLARHEGGLGASATSRSTRAAAPRRRSRRRTASPVYVVEGVTHYCVANMPGAVPITSTKALTNVTLPYVEAIADHGLARGGRARPRARPRRERRSTARSPTRPSPRRTTSSTRRSRTSCRWRRSSARAAARRASASPLRGRELHDEPGHCLPRARSRTWKTTMPRGRGRSPSTDLG